MTHRSPDRPSPNASGFIGGGHAGYNWQAGNIVSGVELSYSRGDLSGNITLPNAEEPGLRDDRFTSDIDSTFQAVFRLGYASGSILAYGKVGYASANLKSEFFDTSNDGGGTLAGSNSRSSERHNGLVLGGGLEYALGNALILGIDYSYINYEAKSHPADFFSAGFGRVTGTTNTEINPDIHAVMGRISYKFGAERHADSLK